MKKKTTKKALSQVRYCRICIGVAKVPKQRWVMLEMHEHNNAKLQPIANQNAF